MKQLLSLLLRLTPGGNYLMAAYSIKQIIVAVVGLKGDSVSVQAPQIPTSSLTDPNSILAAVNSVISAYSTGKTVKEWYKGRKDVGRLDSLESELGVGGKKIIGMVRREEELRKLAIKEVKGLAKEAYWLGLSNRLIHMINAYFDLFITEYPDQPLLKEMKFMINTQIERDKVDSLLKLYDTISDPKGNLEIFINVVLYDKVCKAVSKGKEPDMIEGYVNLLVKRKGELIEYREEYKEKIMEKYQRLNDDYMEDYKHITNNHIDRRGEGNSEEFNKVWNNRPFKGEIQEEEYEDIKYIEVNGEIRKIEEDILQLSNPNIRGIDVKISLYNEYEELCNELRFDEEYQEEFGDIRPDKVDLSDYKIGKYVKGKVIGKEIGDKIGRIKDILGEKDLYQNREVDMWNSEGESSTASFPPAIINDRYSPLRAYNRNIGPKCADWIKDDVVSWGKMTEYEKGCKEQEEADRRDIAEINEGWKRHQELVKREKEREQLGNRVRNWIWGICAFFGFLYVGKLYFQSKSTVININPYNQPNSQQINPFLWNWDIFKTNMMRIIMFISALIILSNYLISILGTILPFLIRRVKSSMKKGYDLIGTVYEAMISKEEDDSKEENTGKDKE